MQATKVQFEDFVRSLVYKDIKVLLLSRLSIVRDDLEKVIPGLSATEQAMIDLVNKGRAEELRYAAELAEVIVENWEEYTKEEEERDGK
jgi:hypothetical protein